MEIYPCCFRTFDVEEEIVMEQNHSENTKRIAKNTLMLYGRMLFSMVVSLYTSRVVLNTLGVVDYGVYNAVGGFVAMFTLISNSLSAAVSRFLTYELGKGNQERLNIAFATSLLIHIFLAFIILILAETAGVWFVNNKMSIPSERLYAANWVFQASIISFLFSIFSVPYTATIVSHEKMGTFAYIGMLDTTLRLFIVLFIAYSKCHFDRLIIYSILLMIVSLILQCIYLVYCRKHFAECRVRLVFDKLICKEIGSFSAWNFIGCAAAILKDQGVNVLLNIFTGPVLNAARGISGSINVTVSSFAGNFMTALNPQITKSYASGDLHYTHYLVERGARFSFYILCFLAIPILLETEFILTIWLGQYPEHTVNFVRLALVLSLVDTLSNTLITLQNATGRIRNYQIVVGGTLLLNFPVSYMCLSFGLQPEATYVVAIMIGVLCMIARLSFLRKTAHLSMGNFLKNVVLNVICVTIVAFLIPYIIHSLLPYGWCRFLMVGFASVISSLLSILLVGCSKSERTFILGKFMVVREKFRR